jgi:protein-arginine deiminase
MLVSPPTPGYPFGRIIYGQSQDLPCELAGFFSAQRCQAPIVLDSTWLPVGHVDEYLSFLPDPTAAHGWGHKILIASVRLGHALCYLAAAQPNAGNPAALIATAVQLSATAHAAGQALVPTEHLTTAFGALQAAGAAAQLARTNGYLADPPVPPNTDGFFVHWSDGTTFDIKPADWYLANQQGEPWLTQAVKDQTAIDLDRGRLTTALQIDPRNFVEIPVIFEGSADSANMLILNNGGAPVCIVPKPFGPVAGGVYLFESCITAALHPFNPTVHFVNDWVDFHANHGEIHCGTNQVPVARVIPWWEHAPA